MSDRVKFGADAQEYFDVVDKIRSAHTRLGEHINRTGGEFGLRTSLRVEQNVAQFARTLAEARTGLDVVAAGVERVGLSLKGSFAFAAIAGATIGTITAIKRALDEDEKSANAARDAIQKALSVGVGSEGNSIDDLGERATKLTDGVVAAQKRIDELQNRGSVKKFAFDLADLPSIDNPKSGEAYKRLAEKRVLESQIADAKAAQNTIDENIAARSAAELSILRLKVDGQGEAASLSEAELKSKERIAQLFDQIAAGKIGPGAAGDRLTDLVDLGQAEKASAKNQITDREMVLRIDKEIAEVRGNPEDRALKVLELEVDKAKELELYAQNTDRAGEARVARIQKETQLFEHQLALSIRRLQAEAAVDALAIKHEAGSRSVNAPAEEGQRNELVANIEVSQRALRAADDRIKKEGETIDALKDQRTAIFAVADAQDALAKFDLERAFAHAQTLKAAQAVTSEMGLQAQGEDHLAELAGIREAYEGKIAQHLHEGREDLAEQDRRQQSIARLNAKAAELAKSPAQREAERIAQRQRDFYFRNAAAGEADEADRRRRGAYTRHPDAYDRSPDAYSGPGDRNRRSPLGLSGDHDWSKFNERFHPLRDQATSDRADKSKAADNQGKEAGSELGGKLDTLVGAVNDLKNTTNTVWGGK
jgi:hypothetical protein